MVVEEQAVSGKVRAVDRPKFKRVLDTFSRSTAQPESESS
jgi:hypothetical protein